MPDRIAHPLLDLLQVSLLINKQTGGKKKKKREGGGGGGGGGEILPFSFPFSFLPSRLFIDQERELKQVQPFVCFVPLLGDHDFDWKQ